MTTQRLGLIMNGVTGRMGLNQHLIPLDRRDPRPGRPSSSPMATRVMPDPILVGRDAGKVEKLAKQYNIARWGTDLDAALADKKRHRVLRCRHHAGAASLLTRAIEAGKHVYCEKPIATNLEESGSRCAVLPMRAASSTARCRTSCSCRA